MIELELVGFPDLFQCVGEVKPHLHLDESRILGFLVHEHIFALDGKVLHINCIIVIGLQKLLIDNLQPVEKVEKGADAEPIKNNCPDKNGVFVHAHHLVSLAAHQHQELVTSWRVFLNTPVLAGG